MCHVSGSLISPCGPRVHACISIHCYFIYPLLKCINYYRKKVSKHTNAWRLTLALFFSSNCTIALSPLLQAIIKAESPFCMKVRTNIAPIFCTSRIDNIQCLCMMHVPCQTRLEGNNNQYAEDCSDLSKSHWLGHNPIKSYRYFCKV